MLISVLKSSASAHYWARETTKLGHTVKLIPAVYVKPFVKRPKNDAPDAEAACETSQQPTLRFVLVNSEAAQASGIIFRAGDLLVRQRTVINALPGHQAEYGLPVAQGANHVNKLIDDVANPKLHDADRRIWDAAVPTVKPLIAIVDDDTSMREALKGLMRSLGFDTEAFSSADDFLMFPDLNRTACLVTDIHMPGMSGLDLYRQLVALGKSIPTVLITAYPDENARARGLGAGIVGYLTKPFGEEDLLDCIRSALTPGSDGESSS